VTSFDIVSSVDLGAVPTVGDFAVELRGMEEVGQIVHFVSARLGELAWFPGWEHADRDLIHFAPQDVPLGTLDAPYDDRDDGWRILIFEHGGFVYILEDDSPTGTRFPRRWRTPRDRYFQAWAAVMLRFNAPVDLADVFNPQEPDA
jgi:hypothetical protein